MKKKIKRSCEHYSESGLTSNVGNEKFKDHIYLSLTIQKYQSFMIIRKKCIPNQVVSKWQYCTVRFAKSNYGNGMARSKIFP